MTWKELLKDDASDTIKQEIIETLKQLHEVAMNKHIDRQENMREEGVRVTSKKKIGSKTINVVPYPKYIIVLEEALTKLGYDLPKERKAGTHEYSDVSDFKQIRQFD